ncbi:hypothetical protein LZ016_15395 [Sphingomonas sp. SM33]|uniref:Lipoprotein n=1 Tax=Sphingomonas telluris TaxID=2907998 RepID=A0ABS9VR77_9SPHN|nr:hypothetical protein [Sphingomonas telluris]MCH8617482.1 hypothetical protein [Sphingomonas telluris]
MGIFSQIKSLSLNALTTGRSPARYALLAPWLILMQLSACGEDRRPPPASLKFGDLPVSGTLADARRAGFTACVPDNVSMRCRREAVVFQRQGPFSAAVDLKGSDGAGGFDHLTLWHAADQNALIAIVNELKIDGWSECLTPSGQWGGQAIYQRKGAPVFISMDLSYWSKRRLMVFPAVPAKVPRCRS